MKIARFKVSGINPVVCCWVFYPSVNEKNGSSFISVTQVIALLSMQFISRGATSFKSEDFNLKTRVINEEKYAFVIDVHSITN